MKWKRVPTEFLPEKTFLIIKDDLRALEAKENSTIRRKPKSAADTGTWPPKLKNNIRDVETYASVDRPKTANLERPSVLDPRLLKKLDMSLVSKELLCDSMTRIHLGVKSRVGGGPTNGSRGSTCGSSRRRRSEPGSEKSCSFPSSIPIRQQTTPLFDEDRDASSLSLPISRTSRGSTKFRNFDQPTSEETSLIGRMEIFSDSPTMKRQPLSRPSALRTNESPENVVSKRRTSESRRLDDNNNRNNPGNNSGIGKVTSLSTVRRNKSSKIGVSTEIEVFTGAAVRITAPEPCKTCGRPDQPERFHSHPKGSATVTRKEPVSDTVAVGKPKTTVPKGIQKPVAINFRSEKTKNRIKEETDCSKERSKTTTIGDFSDGKIREGTTRPETAVKKGPRTVTCYICAREFGTASFPIHEPKCMQKWERENNALPASQRRPVPQRPIVPVDHHDWNTAAWEQSQAQLVPCWKCGRTFLPDRLEIHERSCKATRKIFSVNSPLADTSEKNVQPSQRTVSGSTTVACQICGRNFGARSVKLHESQCAKKLRAENEALPLSQRKKNFAKRDKSAEICNQDRATIASPARQSPPQKPTTTCYICGRDFGSTSIDIHEPQCLKKWRIENARLPADQRRDEPKKPEIVFTSESGDGSPEVDRAATTEARWKSHLGQLVPCKLCKRTFNPDRVAIHERSCKGTR